MIYALKSDYNAILFTCTNVIGKYVCLPVIIYIAFKISEEWLYFPLVTSFSLQKTKELNCYINLTTILIKQ